MLIPGSETGDQQETTELTALGPSIEEVWNPVSQPSEWTLGGVELPGVLCCKAPEVEGLQVWPSESTGEGQVLPIVVDAAPYQRGGRNFSR